jgi:glycosyltransferase involved in cell wall biosynthesis
MPEMLDFEAFKERYAHVPVEEYPNNVREAVPEPMVSVHIITYNHVDYIREAIESVLMQEVDFPMEIVIGDDESTDGTREICMEYAEQHPDKIRLMLHRRENNIKLDGRPTHLFQYWYNTLSLRGKYIAGVSGDDYWTDPEKLQKQVDFLEKNPEFALSFHDAHKIDQAGSVIEKSILPNRNKRNLSKLDLLKGEHVPALVVMYRNVYSEIPEEVVTCLGEDRFSRTLAGLYGTGSYHQDIRPSIYRDHSGGIFRGLNSVEQKKKLLNTSVAIRRYLHKISASDIVELYNQRIINEKKEIYFKYVSLNMYSKALVLFLDIIMQYIHNRAFKEVIMFSVAASRFLAGNLRRRLFVSEYQYK